MSRARVLHYSPGPSAGVPPYIVPPSGLHHLLYPRRILMGHFTSRISAPSGDNGSARFAAADLELAGRFPALVEFLTERIDEEGKPRITSTLGVSCEDGMWKVCLTDRAQAGGKFDYKLWKSGGTFLEALGAIDLVLQEGSAEWRRFPKWSPTKRP